eukprot:TRINITY_DN1425_c0_g1_i17.p1 TRINITY_DN1425_c0_g1~~TRINITY_DN1425_c0_g1_i17.p1  ORF type:complete len:173 (+),score=23.66 TRINITY_DN1425_c0_g1_i17:68-586(+)
MFLVLLFFLDHIYIVLISFFFFFLMIRRPPRSTLSSSSAASDVYKRQVSTQSTGQRACIHAAPCPGWVAVWAAHQVSLLVLRSGRVLSPVLSGMPAGRWGVTLRAVLCVLCLPCAVTVGCDGCAAVVRRAHATSLTGSAGPATDRRRGCSAVEQPGPSHRSPDQHGPTTAGQ